MKRIKFVLLAIALLLVGCAGALMKGDTDHKDLVDAYSSKQSRATIDKFKTVEIKTANKSKKKLSKKKIVKRDKKVAKEVMVNPYDKEDYPKEFKEYDVISEGTWKKYRPKFFEGEESQYEISWSIFKAGIGTFKTMPNAMVGNTEVSHIHAVLESAKYFEGIYKLKDTLDVYVDTDKQKFRPVKYEMKQRESGQVVDDLQLFDKDKLETYFFYHREKKGKTTEKEKTTFTPRFFTDSFSVLYFLRGLPFKIGAEYSIPISNRGKVWVLSVKVEEIEEIEVLGKDVKAYRLSAQTSFQGVLKKSGDINFWFSTDGHLTLLKFNAKIKIGSVKGHLIKHIKGKGQ